MSNDAVHVEQQRRSGRQLPQCSHSHGSNKTKPHKGIQAQLRLKKSTTVRNMGRGPPGRSASRPDRRWRRCTEWIASAANHASSSMKTSLDKEDEDGAIHVATRSSLPLPLDHQPLLSLPQLPEPPPQTQERMETDENGEERRTADGDRGTETLREIDTDYDPDALIELLLSRRYVEANSEAMASVNEILAKRCHIMYTFENLTHNRNFLQKANKRKRDARMA